ncbi:hypothetical protein D3C78_1623330 [compost metagenome]
MVSGDWLICGPDLGCGEPKPWMGASKLQTEKSALLMTRSVSSEQISPFGCRVLTMSPQENIVMLGMVVFRLLLCRELRTFLLRL